MAERANAREEHFPRGTFQADDAFWAEVLNLGGYHMPAQPFDEMEVSRVLAAVYAGSDKN